METCWSYTISETVQSSISCENSAEIGLWSKCSQFFSVVELLELNYNNLVEI